MPDYLLMIKRLSCRRKTWDSTVEVAVVIVTDSQGKGASMSEAALVPGPNGSRLVVEGLDQACFEG
jgi:hypothetical protein